MELESIKAQIVDHALEIEEMAEIHVGEAIEAVGKNFFVLAQEFVEDSMDEFGSAGKTRKFEQVKMEIEKALNYVAAQLDDHFEKTFRNMGKNILKTYASHYFRDLAQDAASGIDDYYDQATDEGSSV